MDKTQKLIVILTVVAVAATAGVFVVSRQEEPAPVTQANPPVPTQPASPEPATSQLAPSTNPPPQQTQPTPTQPKPSQPSPPPAAQPAAAARPAAAMPERNWQCVVGTPTAPVKIEVFSDFECPACRQFYLDTMRPLMADYGASGQLCVVYREYPLRIHKYSRQAALYALAAARLGRTQWVQVTDQFYYYQAQWAADGQLDPVLGQALAPAEVETVKQWAADNRLETIIDNDLAEGAGRGVRSTPTLFIISRQGTERVTGVVQYQILRRYLDRLLQQP